MNQFQKYIEDTNCCPIHFIRLTANGMYCEICEAFVPEIIKNCNIGLISDEDIEWVRHHDLGAYL